MKYRKGFFYQLAEDEVFQTVLRPEKDIILKRIELYKNGMLVGKDGYAWDGPSGPTKAIVTVLEAIPFIGAWLAAKFIRKFLTPSLGHDIWYQLIRLGKVAESTRDDADKFLKQLCLERKMLKIRAGWVYGGVKNFAGFAADPKNKKKVYEVP